MSSKPLFTPGPWAWSNMIEEVDPREKKPSELVAYGPEDAECRQDITTVLELHIQHSLRSEDAVLIAAAPDLYEALQNAVRVAYEAGMGAEWVEKAKSALAKAGGRCDAS